MSELKGTSVLVTGGAGFIGSSLVRKLEERSCFVTVLDNLIAGRREHLLGTKAELIIGDIRDKELLNYIFNRNQIDFCFHLAANPYIPRGYEDPELMFSINTLGTLNILLTCHEAKVKRILYYSTSEVYGTARTLPMNEKHPTMPHSSYAVAKLAADKECFVLWKERNIPVIILRQFNCFGPREAQPYIIPEIISQFTHRGPILKLGNIGAKRDFTYVDDAALAAIKLMETPEMEGKIINFGRGMNWSVKEIAETTAKAMNINNWGIEIEQARLRPYDVDELLCDNTYFNQLTGGIEYTDFVEGLKRTIEWYNQNGKKWSWEK